MVPLHIPFSVGLHQFLFKIPVRVTRGCANAIATAIVIAAIVIRFFVAIIIIVIAGVIFVVIVCVAASAAIWLSTQIQTVVQQHFIFILLFKMLSNFRVAMLIVGDDNFAGVSGGDACLAIVFTR